MSDTCATLQFLFMRHGQTATNAAGCVTGRLDVPLNDLGREQAAAAAQTLTRLPADKMPRVIVHSGMIRARETAEIVARVLADNGIHVRIEQDEGLKDRDLGAWEGQPWDEVPTGETLTRNELRIARRFPADSETDAQLQTRMLAAIERCLSPDTFGAGVRLFVWHGGIERMLIRTYDLGTGAERLANAKPRCLHRDAAGRYYLEDV